jgi:four helix bundle protein
MNKSPKKEKKNYDMEERTAKFGENTIELIKKIPRNEITIPIINQLIKCTTSVGANFCEADDAESSKDFVHKIGICKKETRESKHFLRMLAKAVPDFREEIIKLWKEAKELNLIFNSIYKKIKFKDDNIVR